MSGGYIKLLFSNDWSLGGVAASSLSFTVGSTALASGAIASVVTDAVDFRNIRCTLATSPATTIPGGSQVEIRVAGGVLQAPTTAGVTYIIGAETYDASNAPTKVAM